MKQILFTLIALITFSCITEPETRTEPQENWASDGNKIAVYYLAEKMIVEQLNDPQSAIFPDNFTRVSHVTYVGNNTYLIDSYLRARNRFGGIVKQRWRVKVFYNKTSYRFSDFETL